MNALPPIHKEARSLLAQFAIEGFNVSWAGPCPRKDVFCLGSDDGEMLFTDRDGIALQSQPDRMPSREAINGVAFIQNWMAVSTRDELDIFTLPKQKGDAIYIAKMPFGAHGVIASPRGYFFAPLGLDGLMFTQPKDGAGQSITISTSVTEQLYFYRVIALRTAIGRQVVACATRSNGVGAMDFQGEDHQHNLSALTFDGLDVVDLCPLDAPANSAAIAALGRDGTLVLFRDIVNDRTPAALRYPAIKGIAYRLFSARGYIFILTSKALYVIAGLVDQFRSSGAVSTHIASVLEVPMEAVDASLVGDQWLLIVLPDGVARFDIDLWAERTPATISHGKFHNDQPAPLTPTWRHYELEQQLKPALASV